MKRHSAAGLPFDRANLLAVAVAPGLCGFFQQWKPFQRWPSRLYNFHLACRLAYDQTGSWPPLQFMMDAGVGVWPFLTVHGLMSGTENSSPGFQAGGMTLRTLEGCGKQLIFVLLPICIAALCSGLQATGCSKEALTTGKLSFMLLSNETLPCLSAF